MNKQSNILKPFTIHSQHPNYLEIYINIEKLTVFRGMAATEKLEIFLISFHNIAQAVFKY